MALLCWIALGLAAGFAGSKFANKTGKGLPMDVAVGVAGAVVGGLLFDAARQSPAVPMNPWSLSGACLASAGVLWVWHELVRTP